MQSNTNPIFRVYKIVFDWPFAVRDAGVTRRYAWDCSAVFLEGGRGRCFQTSPALILRFLWKSRAEWSGREIARQTGLSAPACHEALKQLDARGLALFRRVSNVHLYMINSDNYLVKNVFAPLFQTEDELPGQVLKTINKFLTGYPENKKILSAAIFGSMATGHERLNSDLDLLIVTHDTASAKDLEDRLQDLRTLIYKQFSIPLSPYIQPLAEIRAKHKQKSPLILQILKEGQGIYGKDLKELLAVR